MSGDSLTYVHCMVSYLLQTLTSVVQIVVCVVMVAVGTHWAASDVCVRVGMN